ncbi:WYL domain-containing protein [Bacillus chungangensis]|uniref:DNA-binding transcriptional regulator YafY n=1 Tax=Bacillus chungangensis TaxID=587633 RepID=A0ABT9WLT9_9BACI|nr:hypothetical protein [Bacillus chungangensis]MDQ0174221.1 putative DNA-binding transcriptional regulator YafY [Bacillus chungangensis]
MNGLLMRALESKEKLEIIYLSNSNEISQRKIRVIEVKQSIKVYCFLRKQYRVFSLSNILSMQPLKNKHRNPLVNQTFL